MAKKADRDTQFEIGFFEGVLRQSPDFIEALAVLGDLYTKEGLYEKGLQMDERLAKLRPDDIVFYNLACSYALVNDLPRARQAMARAFELGYCDFKSLKQDPDLASLLADAEFLGVLEQWQRNLPRKAARRTRESV